MLHKAQKCRTGTLPTQQSGARWESHAALLPAKAIMEKMGLREEGFMPNNVKSSKRGSKVLSRGRDLATIYAANLGGSGRRAQRVLG